MGRSLPSCGSSALVRTSPGPQPVAQRAIVIREERRQLRSSQRKGKSIKGEVKEKLNRDLQK